MPKIVEISSYFSSKTNFKKSISNVKCNPHQVLVDYLTQFSYKHSLDGLYKTYLFLTSDEKAAAYISFSITTIDGNDTKSYIRNETVHGSPPRFEDVKILREKIIGVACESMMIEIVKIRAKGFDAKEKR